MLAVQVICAESSRRAYDLSLSLGLARLLLAKGVPEPIASVTDASAYPYSSSEKAFVEQFQEICVLGTEDEVEEKLELLSAQFETDEFSVVTGCHDFERRCESYRLLAKRFGLKG